MRKYLLCPHRLRQVPRQFSWIDQGFLRHGYFHRCGKETLILYFFLITVADAQGLSYYSDATIGNALNLDQAALTAARRELIALRLIVFRPPLYQVLALPENHLDIPAPQPEAVPPTHPAPTAATTQPIGALIDRFFNPNK